MKNNAALVERAHSTPERKKMIMAWLNDTTGKIQLEPRVETLFERFQKMDHLIWKHKTMNRCVQKQMKIFGVSKQTAINDFYDAQEVMCSRHKYNPRYNLRLLMDMGMEELIKLEEEGKRTAKANLIAKLIDVNAKMAAQEEETIEIPKPAIIIVTPDATALGKEPIPEEQLELMLQEWRRKPKAGRPSMFGKDAEDISHEEVVDG